MTDGCTLISTLTLRDMNSNLGGQSDAIVILNETDGAKNESTTIYKIQNQSSSQI